MNQIQLDALMTIVHQLPDLVKQLEIANKLKALELKGMIGNGNLNYITSEDGHLNYIIPEMVDSALEGKC